MPNPKLHLSFSLLLLITSIFVSGCKNGLITEPKELDFDFRGEIISIELLHSWTIAQTDSALAAYDPDLLTYPNDYPIDIYRIVYKTVDAFNNETQASGAIVLPKSADVDFVLWRLLFLLIHLHQYQNRFLIIQKAILFHRLKIVL